VTATSPDDVEVRICAVYDSYTAQMPEDLHDAKSRLTSAGGASYTYDPIGNRVESAGASVTDTVYFGGQPIARYAAGQWTDLVYGPTGLLAEVPGTQNGAPVYRVTDHLGSTVGSLLADGTFVNGVDYNPYGQVIAGGTNDPYVYTGLEHDSESNLEHAQFRQYSSTLGRWISPDPYNGSMDLANPQSFNRYSYVGNNPMRLVDLSGLDDCDPATMDPATYFDCRNGGLGGLMAGGGNGSSGNDGPCHGEPNCPNNDPPPPPPDSGFLYEEYSPIFGAVGSGPSNGGGGGGGAPKPPKPAPSPPPKPPQPPSPPKNHDFSPKTCFGLDWGMSYLGGLSLFTAVQPEAAPVSVPLGAAALVGWSIGKIGGC
jgi:RHS repeat-associated protein